MALDALDNHGKVITAPFRNQNGNSLDTETLIKTLQLEPHPLEGGYFKRSYQSELCVNTETGQRFLLTCIYYLLTQEQPVGFFHRNRSDIVHYYHLGGAIRYSLISPEGDIEQRVLGSDLAAGQELQLTVPGGYWKASELLNGSFGLISEAVAPGFDYRDNELATYDTFEAMPSSTFNRLKKLIKR